MPSELAALLCVVLIAFLFWRELSSPAVEKISWVPFIWMFIAGSRFVSTWLNLRAPTGVDGNIEGSPIDRTFFLTLIIAGSIVLARRNIRWGDVFRQNKWLVAYLAYCLCSILWTDEPFVLFKRWIKDLGNPIMVLILLTERRPYDAIAATIRRLSYLFLPLSVLFIKYYPELGRFYTRTGAATFTGVGDQKNTLGLVCLITTLFFAWSYLHRREIVEAIRYRHHWLLIAMIAWLLQMANSQTALLCLTIALAILFLSVRPAIAKRPMRLLAVVLLAAIGYMVADATFEVQERVFALLGRDSTLTNRTTIWELVSRQETNPLIGVGFMSFWQGERLIAITEALGAGLNQAHNGYLEQYVNLGFIGVGFIVIIAFTSFLHARRQLVTDYPAAILRFSLLIVALLYNYTEASFYGINNMWVLFLATVIRPPTPVTVPAVSPVRTESVAAPRWRYQQRRPAFARSVPRQPVGAYRRPR